MANLISPSCVKKPLFGTVWQNCEKETVATNILKLARYGKGDKWESFTWADYVDFCSHQPSEEEHRILDEFASTGYLEKGDGGAYSFTNKIIGVYGQYCD